MRSGIRSPLAGFASPFGAALVTSIPVPDPATIITFEALLTPAAVSGNHVQLRDIWFAEDGRVFVSGGATDKPAEPTWSVDNVVSGTDTSGTLDNKKYLLVAYDGTDGSLLTGLYFGSTVNYGRPYAGRGHWQQQAIGLYGRAGTDYPTTSGAYSEGFTSSASAATYGQQTPFAMRVDFTDPNAFVVDWATYGAGPTTADFGFFRDGQMLDDGRSVVAFTFVQAATGYPMAGVWDGSAAIGIINANGTGFDAAWYIGSTYTGGGNPSVWVNSTKTRIVITMGITTGDAPTTAGAHMETAPVGVGALWTGIYDFSGNLQAASYWGDLNNVQSFGYETHNVTCEEDGSGNIVRVIIGVGNIIPDTFSETPSLDAYNRALGVTTKTSGIVAFNPDMSLHHFTYLFSSDGSANDASFVEGIALNDHGLAVGGGYKGSSIPVTDGSVAHVSTRRSGWGALLSPDLKTLYAAHYLCPPTRDGISGVRSAAIYHDKGYGFTGLSGLSNHHFNSNAFQAKGVVNVFEWPAAPYNPLTAIDWRIYCDMSDQAITTSGTQALTVANAGTDGGVLTSSGGIGSVKTGIETLNGKNVLTFDEVSGLLLPVPIGPGETGTWVIVFEGDSDRTSFAASEQTRSTLIGPLSADASDGFIPRSQAPTTTTSAWVVYTGSAPAGLYVDGVSTSWPQRDDSWPSLTDDTGHLFIVEGTMLTGTAPRQTVSVLGHGTGGGFTHAFKGKVAFVGYTEELLTTVATAKRTAFETYATARWNL